MRALAIPLVLVGALASDAVADVQTPTSFEDVTVDAVRLDRAGLGAVLWSRTAACDQGDDLARRQCRQVRDARLRRVAGKTLVVPAEATAFTVGGFDADKRSVPLELKACVACAEPLEGLFVAARQLVIHQTARTFETEAAAVRWRTEVVPRLRTELLISLTAGGVEERDGARHLPVDVIGFRVYDPCDGGLVCVSPRSTLKAPIDRAACGETVAEGVADPATPAPVVEVVPEELTADQIKSAMRPVRDAAEACRELYGVAGDGKLHVTVAGDGAVVAVSQKGDFAGTPTGTCVEKAVRAIPFPKTKKSKQSFNYPIVLR